MTLAPPRPDEAPYLADHWRSKADRRSDGEQPNTFAALHHWWVTHWSDSMPVRMHTHAVEDGDAWGAPRLAGEWRQRLLSVNERGWYRAGWDRHGQPRGVDDEGNTIDPFLYHVERMLNDSEKQPDGTWRRTMDAHGMDDVLEWTYLGYSTAELAARHGVAERFALAVLERILRRLWWRLHDDPDPVRWARCPQCKRRVCACVVDKSESQVNAEEAAG